MKYLECRHFFTVAILSMIAFGCNHNLLVSHASSKGKAYYLSLGGNDAGMGNKLSPWKSIEKLNGTRLGPGDTVFFDGSQAFQGSIMLDSLDAGTKANPVVITSFGNANAVIDAGNFTAMVVNKAAYIKINKLRFIGSGRKDGNTKDGVVIMNSSNIAVDSLDISGFQKAGLLVYTSKNIEVKNVYAHENGFAGISILGHKTKESCSNIHLVGCSAVNNPGDPTNLNSHSGNGILAGVCKNVIIEYSTATNNGWDMPRIGNGPVGIWAYEADHIIIKNCISYKNQTSVGGEDGGGFDLDGGVTNSIIQQCLSYDNQGSGFGIFQYNGASIWHDNVIRNNISENDGNVSRAGASAFIWNGSKDKNQFKNLQFYNNILYNSKGAVITYDAKESQHTGFRFYNNIFVANDQLVKGKDTIGNDVFLHNDWWSLASGFNMSGVRDFKTWARESGKEQVNGKIVGYNEDPQLNNAGNPSSASPVGLKAFFNAYITKNKKLNKNLLVYK